MLIEWVQNTWLNIIENFEEEKEVVDEYSVEIFQGKQCEVDILKDYGNAVDMQFGEGSVCYGVSKSEFIKLRD